MRRVVIEEFFKVYRETRRANCQAFAGTPHHRHISPEATAAVPACIRLLGAPWPCSKPEVQQAFRQLVKIMHPDGGGTNESFHQLYEAYQEALALLPKRRG